MNLENNKDIKVIRSNKNNKNNKNSRNIKNIEKLNLIINKKGKVINNETNRNVLTYSFLQAKM